MLPASCLHYIVCPKTKTDLQTASRACLLATFEKTQQQSQGECRAARDTYRPERASSLQQSINTVSHHKQTVV
jgi:hypothetical protein